MSPTPKPPRHLKPLPTLKEKRSGDERRMNDKPFVAPERRRPDPSRTPDGFETPDYANWHPRTDRRKEYIHTPKGAPQSEVDWLHSALRGMQRPLADRMKDDAKPKKPPYRPPRVKGKPVRLAPEPGDRRTGEDRYHTRRTEGERREGDRRVAPPKPKPKDDKLKSSSGEGPFQEYGDPGDDPGNYLNRNWDDKAYADWVDAENARKDAEWEKSPAGRAARAKERKAEKDQLDQDVRESPSAEKFLEKMRDKAKEQQEAEKWPKLPEQKGRPNFVSPLPPYHTPPDPSGKSPGRRSEPRHEYDKDYKGEKGEKGEKTESKAIDKGPDRKPIPPYKPGLKPPPGRIIPRDKPGTRTDTRTIARDDKRPIPPRKKPTRTLRPLPGVSGGPITTAKRR